MERRMSNDTKPTTSDGDDRVAPTSFRRFCNTGVRPLQMFLYQEEDGTFVQLDADREDMFDGTPANGSQRLLQSWMGTADLDRQKGSMSAITPSSSISARELQNSNMTGRIIYARECVCALDGPYYCPIGAETCRVWDYGGWRRRWEYDVRCEGKPQDLMLRFILPVCGFAFLYILCYLAGSQKGKYALVYLRRLVCCWNEDRYQRVLVEELDERARRSYRQQLARARRSELTRQRQSNNVKVPGSLKTRVFKEGMHSECMICLVDFEEGERVGDLPCGHVFHVEPCLKQWLRRKNHCPLCHTENIAHPTDKTPQHTQDGGVPEETGTTTALTSHSHVGEVQLNLNVLVDEERQTA